MHVSIFGASGRTGRPLVQQALAAGHAVTALVRTPEAFPLTHANLTVVQGDATDPAAVRAAIPDGTDAVFVALGHADGSPKDVLTMSTRHILAAMEASGVRRIVNLTGGGVASPKDPPFLPAKIVRGIMRVVAGPLLKDSERQHALLAQSGLDWTNVRGPRLTEGPETGESEVGYLKLGPASVSRADVARFMLNAAERGEWIGEAPHITSA